VGWNFSNLEISIFFKLSKIYATEIFVIFAVSYSVCDKTIFIKKIWVHRLSFKIDAIDGKKRAKFVAMQQNSAALITKGLKTKLFLATLKRRKGFRIERIFYMTRRKIKSPVDAVKR